MTNEQLQARALAIVATVAEDRHTDVDALLADLTAEDTATVVAALAALALRCWLPSAAAGTDPAARQRGAQRVRQQLLVVEHNAA
ncbi:hypothetical protein [Streptomyces sp. OM5714]|uniref:hypothetical protein n=1 Tax=Streptomyces sp. OM5714 TaxID=2602736 RepID=UPI0013DB3911|nr:hypothetical protein [Streptomyces sp. OM5714]KAF2778580.1 hypothetical protein STPH1_3242 [Streptomyces sp. OM5714]